MVTGEKPARVVFRKMTYPAELCIYMTVSIGRQFLDVRSVGHGLQGKFVRIFHLSFLFLLFTKEVKC